MQGNLFDEVEERRQVRQLRKVPFDFYHPYAYDIPPQGVFLCLALSLSSPLQQANKQTNGPQTRANTGGTGKKIPTG